MRKSGFTIGIGWSLVAFIVCNLVKALQYVLVQEQ
jgi:hypothetical protein